MKMKTIAGLLLTGLLAAPTVQAENTNHWGYTGHGGPEQWGEIDDAYATCATGKNQSPVNLVDSIDAELPPIHFDYRTAANEILNNGHTVQAGFAGGNGITLHGRRFELKQVHFHTPSENHVAGKSFPLEAHLVHADPHGNLTVVAIMFEEGAENDAIAKLWKQMPTQAGQHIKLAQKVSASELLPKGRGYFRFSGSLTTPPCSEGVTWLVMADTVSIGRKQVEHFAHILHHPNNRPVQPLNARVILH